MSLKATTWIAQLDKCPCAEQEVAGSNPNKTNTQGLKYAAFVKTSAKGLQYRPWELQQVIHMQNTHVKKNTGKDTQENANKFSEAMNNNLSPSNRTSNISYYNFGKKSE